MTGQEFDSILFRFRKDWSTVLLRGWSLGVRTLLVYFLLIQFGPLGCGSEAPGNGEPPAPSVTFERRDSAGIEITTTSKEGKRVPVGWTVDSEPDLVIGAGDDPSTLLYRVRGLQGLSQDRILVVNGGSRELLFFDREGHLEARVGGRGEGPGEFEDPVLVPQAERDSLLLWDRDLLRFQLFSARGESPRTIRPSAWPRGAGSFPPVGTLDRQMLIMTRGVWTGDFAQSGGAKKEPRRFLWLDPGTGAEAAVTSFEIERVFIWERRGQRGAMDLIPFSPEPTGTVWEGGGLISDGRTCEIREYDLEGRPTRTFRVDGPGRSVTDQVIDAYIEMKVTGSGRSRSSLKELYADMPIPETLPCFRSLEIDERGWLWVQVFEWDPSRPVPWVVFDPSGRALGTVEMPPGLTVHWIGEDHVLGVWTDELGVEQVRRHRLRKDDSQLE